MNVKVGADAINASLTGKINTPRVKTQLNIDDKTMLIVDRVCPAFTPITVNGHSISAIAPDFVERRMAALV